MAVLTITLGTTAQLQVKVPVKGETNWSTSFKTEFAQKIVEHDHTGVDGKGSKIATAAIEDLAVTAAKINSDVVLSTLGNVSATSPTAGQVLKWGGSEWAPATDQAGSGGGSITTIANQTDANVYSTTEGDTLKITGAVTFTDVTFNKLNIYVDDGITLTFNSSDVAECKITGGNVIFKGTSSHSSDSTIQTTGIDTFSIKRSQIFCEQVDILQELAEQSGLVTTTVEDTFINCKTYRYYTTYTSISSGGSPDGNPTASLSTFSNVTIIAQSEGTISGSGLGSAVAVFSDMLVSNLSSIAVNRNLLFDAVDGNHDYEAGSKTNCNKISTTSA